MRDGRGKVFVALGGNFLSATPDVKAVAEGLRRCRLTVQVSTKLNRSHLITGRQALILPCLGRSERDGRQFVTVENSMGIVHASRGKLEPISHTVRSEPAIVSGMARAVLTDDQTPWTEFAEDYGLIRQRIEKTISGFDHFEQRVAEPGGFYLPNSAKERRFGQNDKAPFSIHPLEPLELTDDQLVLMTIRSHDQFNTTSTAWTTGTAAFAANAGCVSQSRGHDRARTGPEQPVNPPAIGRAKPAKPSSFSPCPTICPAAVRRPMSPRPTSSFRSTAPPVSATRPPPNPSSSQWKRPIDLPPAPSSFVSARS